MYIALSQYSEMFPIIFFSMLKDTPLSGDSCRIHTRPLQASHALVCTVRENWKQMKHIKRAVAKADNASIQVT